MKSGRRTLHADSPLPAQVHRRHEEPTTSDNFGAIDRASREPIGPDGLRTNDCNGQAYWAPRRGAFVVAGGHWHHPARNGYTRVKRRLLPGTRPMTKREHARQVWTWGQVRRTRRPNGERPRTIEELYTHGVIRGVVQIVEEKHPAFALPEVATAVVAAARRHDHPTWYMVLDDMAPRGKVHATRAAGGQIAMIFGHDQIVKPPQWASWDLHPNEIWGPDWTRKWLPA